MSLRTQRKAYPCGHQESAMCARYVLGASRSVLGHGEPRVNDQEATIGWELPSCASQLSVTVTKYLRHQLRKKKGLFCLTVLEASVHDLLSPLFWVCGGISREDMHGGVELPTSWLRRKREKEEETGVSQSRAHPQ